MEDIETFISELPKRLGRREAAAYLTEHGYPTSPRALEKLAASKNGPPFRRYLKTVTYEVAALLAWAESVSVEMGGNRDKNVVKTQQRQ